MFVLNEMGEDRGRERAGHELVVKGVCDKGGRREAGLWGCRSLR